MQLRLLNSSHPAIAYLDGLLNHKTAHQAMEDRTIWPVLGTQNARLCRPTVSRPASTCGLHRHADQAVRQPRHTGQHSSARGRKLEPHVHARAANRSAPTSPPADRSASVSLRITIYVLTLVRHSETTSSAPHVNMRTSNSATEPIYRAATLKTRHASQRKAFSRQVADLDKIPKWAAAKRSRAIRS